MSERQRIVAANWKMHKTMDEVRPYFAAFLRAAPSPAAGVVVAFLPPFPLLPAVVEALSDRADAEVGAQDCHWEAAGAYTGAVSAPSLASCGARRVLVGHSERRHEFGDTDEIVARKLRAALRHGLAPTLCVGERLEERDAGRARAVVLAQLSRAAEGLDRADFGRLSVAYEPVWAIGTGRTARAADAQEMHAAIRDALGSIAAPDLAARIPVLYGGSVKPDNAAELMAETDVDGALVGGASLEPASFAAILAAAPRAG